MQIKNYKFSKSFKDEFKDDEFKNFPLVYIINNDKIAYVGESTNIKARVNSHLSNKERNKLNEIKIITDKEFNQSATYNIETNLINHLIADQTYKLQNVSQTKQRTMHNYYNKSYYNKEVFSKVWDELRAQNFVEQTLEQIENKDVFKISPYKSLSEEQAETKMDIINFCKENIEAGKKAVYVVQGEAGTGKSVLISSLYNTLQDLSKSNSSELKGLDNYLIINHKEMQKTYKNIAKVLPNIQANHILKSTPFLNKVERSNITIVDEAHLLLSSSDTYNNYHGNNQVEDIIEKSDITILIYDPKQYLKIGAYWDEKKLSHVLSKYDNTNTKLVNQLRMNANKNTIIWMNALVNKRVLPLPCDEGYDLQVFKSAKDMHNEIIQKNNKFGLSRIVSTFDFLHMKKEGITYYVETDDFKLPWNSEIKNTNWAEAKETIDEVGSIYTIQGFDLNYVGVILGPSVRYNEKLDKIEIDISKYKDKKAFSVPSTFDKSINVDKVKEQIILNSINILLKRGIKGTYIYAYDEKLREKLLNS